MISCEQNSSNILNSVSLHELCQTDHIQSLNCLICKKSMFTSTYSLLFGYNFECVNYFCCSLSFICSFEMYIVRRMTVYSYITSRIYFNYNISLKFTNSTEFVDVEFSVYKLVVMVLYEFLL